ncbi:MAG: 3,5-dihydroxyphenylacetyl-CoA synthase DpgA [Myxococcota bacterium]|nr:3,5-dihydroxyphenylacetyl-CoA synthase DpgA [Myxococcota bacterium]
MHAALPRILSVGTSVPPNRYTQQDIIDRFRVANPTVRKIFSASHIEGRHLYLPEPDESGVPHESQAQLLAKHRKGALELGKQAISRCLESTDYGPEDIDMLCCISSSGFMLPGLTAMFIKHLGFRTDCHRMDLVGMGCNAGLNGLNPVTSWVKANPGRLAMMICCEVNSALYIYDDSIGTGVVNSLFGDGCAAIMMRADHQDDRQLAPAVLSFASHIIPETWRAMSYHWDENHGKFSFNLARDVPYVLGSHAHKPVAKLLKPFGLKKRDISHWIIHSGGKKVIDAIKYTVGITAHAVRHTTHCLKRYGNLGSGSFLFAYQRMLGERCAQRGDYGVMMTMGPGSTIETALLRW